VPSVGVEGLAAHVAVGPVHLVGYGELGGLLGDLVDLGVDFRSLGGVGFARSFLVKLGNAVEERLFLLEVDRAVARGTLEQEVLKVVGEARVGGGVVLAPRPRDDLGVEARFLVVRADVDGEPVLKAVRVHLHGIVRVGGPQRVVRVVGVQVQVTRGHEKDSRGSEGGDSRKTAEEDGVHGVLGCGLTQGRNSLAIFSRIARTNASQA